MFVAFALLTVALYPAVADPGNTIHPLAVLIGGCVGMVGLWLDRIRILG
jgi:hypothetical protein